MATTSGHRPGSAATGGSHWLARQYPPCPTTRYAHTTAAAVAAMLNASIPAASHIPSRPPAAVPPRTAGPGPRGAGRGLGQPVSPRPSARWRCRRAERAGSLVGGRFPRLPARDPRLVYVRVSPQEAITAVQRAIIVNQPG